MWFLNSGSLENPSVSLRDPDAWDRLGLGGDVETAGSRITTAKILAHPPVWKALNLISRTVGKLPLCVFRDDGQGDRRRAKEHPAYRLLKRAPNAAMIPFRFKQTLTFHAAAWGNGYAAIFRKRGLPVSLVPLDPELTVFERRSGAMWYHTTSAVAGGRWIAAEDVLHITGFSHDGISGINVFETMRKSLALGIAAREFGTKFFANGSNSGGVLMLPKGLTPEARNQRERDWDEGRKGLNNAFRTAILEEGARYIPTTVTPEAGQFLETRKFESREAANMFCVPPHKVGDDARSSYNSLEQENQSFLDETIDPWLVTWEEECAAKLLSEAERENETHLVEFIRDALLRADRRTETDSLIQEVNNGLLLPDEARKIRNMPALPNGIGTHPRMPANISILAPALPAPEPEPAPTPDTKAASPPATDTDRSNAEWRAANDVAGKLRALLVDRVTRLQAIADKVDRADDAKRAKFVATIRDSMTLSLEMAIAVHGAQASAATLVETVTNAWLTQSDLWRNADGLVDALLETLQ
jgi:HK97 family phage portal protein